MKFANIALVLLVLCTANLAQAKEPAYKMRWLIAHGPKEVIAAGVEAFAKEVEAKTDGDIKIISDDSGFRSGEPTSERNRQAMVDIQNGKFEMGQIYSSVLVKLDKNFGVFDVPFLIRDHDHATKFFDSKQGETLLANLSNFGLYGASFTYSGGYRVIVTKAKNKIDSIEAFKGKRISYIGPYNYGVADSLYLQLQAKPVTLKKQRVVAALGDGEIEGYETVYARIQNLGEVKNGDYAVNETYHNLQTTVLVINAKFFAALPAKYQKIVAEAAKHASTNERRVSIEASEKAKSRLEKSGVLIVKMSSADQQRMKDLFAKTTPDYAKYFDDGYLKSVQDLK